MYLAGAAAVRIVPSLQGFPSSLARQIESPATAAGALAATSLGRSASRTLPGQLAGVSRAFDAVYGRAERMAASSGTAIGRGIGRGTTSALGPLGRLRDGFVNANVAASAFSGRAGTIGGVVRKGCDAASAHIDATSGKFTGLRTRAGTALRGVAADFGRVTAAAGGLAAGAAIATIGTQAVGMAINVQSAEAALTGLYGSAQQAQSMLTRLRAIAKSSPIDYGTWIAGAQSLAYMGYEGDRAVTVLKRIETALVASGKGADSMNRVTEAMLAMVNQGKASADEINQMSQAGFPAWEMLANHMGMSIADVRKAVEAGKLSIEDMIAAMEKGGGPTFAKMAAAAKAGGSTLANTFARVKNNVVLSLSEMIQPLITRLTPAVARAGDAVQRGFAALPGLLRRIGDSAGFGLLVAGLRDLWGTVTDAVVPALDNLWQAIQPVVAVVGGALLFAFRAVAAILRDWIGPALVTVTGWLVPLRPLIVGIAVAFGTWFAIGLAIRGVIGAVGLLHRGIMLLVGAWKVLSLAFAASPIGFVISLLAGLVAAVIYAWNNFAWFRTAVTAVFGAIGAAVRWVGGVLSWLWTTIVGPVFSAIATAVGIAAAVITSVFVLPVVAAIRLVGAVAMWLWRNVFQPAFGMIGRLVMAAWRGLIKPALGGITGLLRGVGGVLGWLWRTVAVPAWNGIAVAARWAWRTVLQPTCRGITSVVRGVGAVFSWLWRNAIKPAWDGISSMVGWVWRTILKPIFGAFAAAGRKIGEAFQGLKSIFTKVFDAIWSVVKKPIQITLDVVWNKSLRQVVNAARWLGGSPPLPEIRLARGGVIPGYAPGRDQVAALLSPGEGVLVPELVRLLGPDTIRRANEEAMRRSGRGKGAGGTGRFAGGGVAGKPRRRATGTPGAEQAQAAPSITPADLKAVTVATEALDTASLALATTTSTVLLPAWLTWTTALRATVTPMLVRIQRHVGALLVQANTRLATSTSQLRTQLSTLWTAVANRVVSSHNTVAQRQRGLQSQLRNSWQQISASVWSSVTSQRSALTALNNGMAATRRSMSATADWGRSAYGRLREAAASPIRWVLRNPFARGLVAAWNQLNRQFSFRRPISAPAVAFASGGQVHGSGTGTSDSILARLSRGEFVVRERISRMVRPFLEALNRGEPEALQATGARRFRRGGLVADTGSALNAALLRGIAFAKAQHGKPYIWGGVGPRGFDCSGFMSAITNVLRGEHPYRRLGVARSQPWPGFRSGLGSAFATGYSTPHTAGTLGGTNVESGGSPSRVKFGVGAAGADDAQFTGHAYLPVVGGRFVSGGAGGGINPEAVARQAFARTYRLIRQVGDRFPGNLAADHGAGVARRSADRVQREATRRLDRLVAFSGGPAGSPEVRAAVKAVAAKYGWDTGPNWAATDWILQHESGWNPNARNPNSSAAGLAQKMQSVHGPVEPTVAGQADWFFRYVRDRYGSPVAAKGFWEAHGHYDSGGWLPPGLSTVYNGTGRPEAVFTADQFEQITDRRDGDTARPIYVYARTDADPAHIAHTIDRHLSMSTRL